MVMTFTAACVQMRSGITVSDNTEAALALVREAARGGATYVQTPEMTNILQPNRPLFFEAIQAEDSDPTLAAMVNEAKALKIWLHLGSIAVKFSETKAANRGFLISPDGEIVARYDKIHMFDVDLGQGRSYRESEAYSPGETAVMASTPLAAFGLSVCYDLRFPALYRALAEAGAQVLTIPSSFTVPTGQAHWHVLMRARAIENGAFVIAAAQGGKHESGRETFGHSLIINPWGEIIAEAAHDEPCVIMAQIDLGEVDKARSSIPSLANGRRFSLHRPTLSEVAG
jgi:predicted amidohydrolase